MTPLTMGRSYLFLLSVSALAINSCSPGPAPVATSLRDPSNPAAPEGASPLSSASPPAEAPEGDHAHHHDPMHGAPSAPDAAGATGLTGAGEEAPSPGPKSALYVCPMHPAVTSPSPARCSKCGMNLVPKK
jgi:hypothetical protein